MADEIIKELGSSDEDSLCIVTRSFFLRVRNGPLQRVEPSQHCRLTPQTAADTFYSGRTEPIEVAEEFEIVRSFQWIKDGEYINLGQGDLIRLTRDEAIKLLREQMVKERR